MLEKAKNNQPLTVTMVIIWQEEKEFDPFALKGHIFKNLTLMLCRILHPTNIREDKNCLSIDQSGDPGCTISTFEKKVNAGLLPWQH